MQSRTGIRAQIEPLTHPGGDGDTFKRSSQVEAQIVEALSLDPSLLIGRVAIEDYRQSGYLKEECVVYLIRKLQRDSEFDLAGQFMNYLATRIAKRVHRQLSKALHRTLVDQCFRDVISEVTCRVIDLSSDADDFAQVRFGRWLEWLTFKMMRPYFRCQDRARKSDSDHEETQDRSDKKALVDTGPLPDELLLRKEVLSFLDRLDPSRRTAFVLRYYAGWEILRISKYLKRSTKTISKWLTEAQQQLREWQ